MKNCNAPENRTTRGIPPIACAAALAVACMVSPPHAAHANKVAAVIPPPMPASIQVPAGNTAYLVGHAVGMQDYICDSPAPNVYFWLALRPQATLFNDYDRQVITHFSGPNPLEPPNTLRGAWQHSEDTSTVWGLLFHISTDPAFVVPGAIPWALFQVVGAKNGPTGGHTLTATTWMQQLTTSGGAAPATGCSQSQHVGTRAFVPFSADYFFYR